MSMPFVGKRMGEADICPLTKWIGTITIAISHREELLPTTRKKNTCLLMMGTKRALLWKIYSRNISPVVG